ncbi:MAG TPA: glycosyltransferase family 1 protein [Acidimicrobiales bacterium]|nr:glycosyltransferase family 1 protein [Acidimicrobiales bacterium]
MRVLVVAEQLRRSVPGGVGTYAHGLLTGLAATGAGDVSVHASRSPGRDDPLSGYGFPVRASPLPARGLTRAWDIGLIGAPGGFDVVHSVSQAFPSPRRRGGRGHRPRLTVMVHDLSWRWVPEAFPPRGRRWHEATLARAVARAAALVTPSEEAAASLRKEGAARVEVVPEGCDHLPPPDQGGADRLLTALGVAGPFLLSVGTQEPRKNLSRVVEAYGRARTRLPEPWPLVVVGPPGWGPDLPPSPGVVRAGRVDAAVLAALYGRARCLVYVPLVEGFGLPPVEGMAHGAPVVASPMPSTGGAALEVDPVDVAAVAEAIVAAAADEEVRRGLVAAGAERAARLTWEACARRHLELWRSLC